MQYIKQNIMVLFFIILISFNDKYVHLVLNVMHMVN
jgi:hypothetical protein